MLSSGNLRSMKATLPDLNGRCIMFKPIRACLFHVLYLVVLPMVFFQDTSYARLQLRVVAVDTLSEGNESRPIFSFVEDKIYLVTRRTKEVGTGVSNDFILRVYDLEFNDITQQVMGDSMLILVGSDSLEGFLTDHRMIYVDTHFYIIYETKRDDLNNAYLRKYTQDFASFEKCTLFENVHGTPGGGQSWQDVDMRTDDPGFGYANGFLYATHCLRNGYEIKDFKVFRVDTGDIANIDTFQIDNPFKYNAEGFGQGMFNPMVVFYDSSYYLISDTPKSDSQPPAKEGELVLLKYSQTWELTDTMSITSTPDTVEYRPTDITLYNSDFWMVYCAYQGAPPRENWLNIYDAEFNLRGKFKITGENDPDANHPVIGISDSTHYIYVVYPCGSFQDGSAMIVAKIYGLKGDINGDGIINIIDVLLMVRYVLLEIDLTPDQFWRADCNGDGGIDVLDVVGIVNVILGVGTCLPVSR